MRARRKNYSGGGVGGGSDSSEATVKRKMMHRRKKVVKKISCSEEDSSEEEVVFQGKFVVEVLDAKKGSGGCIWSSGRVTVAKTIHGNQRKTSMTSKFWTIFGKIKGRKVRIRVANNWRGWEWVYKDVLK
eukprot:TRINITY_DN3457_c0_g1_i1.p1 TRINITY_DN3457_c0_g1~~TRINITY_DN3457_c0_g1_i1.p1  ORF type:complete len:130 (+),score=24.51 TRINITY_DN3457_c0_g1_i1:86-475(+)